MVSLTEPSAARATLLRLDLDGLSGDEVEGALREYVRELEHLVQDLADSDACQFDHHGHCLAHVWLEADPPCPHRRAMDLLSAVRCSHHRTVMRNGDHWLHVDQPHLSRCDAP